MLVLNLKVFKHVLNLWIIDYAFLDTFHEFFVLLPLLQFTIDPEPILL